MPQRKSFLFVSARFSAILCALLLVAVSSADAESKKKIEPPKDAFSVLNIFDGKLPAIKLANGQIVDVSSDDDASSAEVVGAGAKSSGAPAANEKVATTETAPAENAATLAAPASDLPSGAVIAAPKQTGPEFVSSDPKSHIVPPDQDPRVRINPEAPGPFKAMAASFQEGDMESAKAYADQYVRYQVNLMFQVREMTKLIMDALVRQELVEEEDTVGVEQYIDVTLARSRNENGEVLKPTHKQAMERIKADPKGEAELYFFFTLNCSWCREMAPDIERLWQATKKDKRVKIAALAIGKPSKDWLRSYTQYTGLTMPIFDGDESAKALRVGIVPAVVIVSPGNKTSYLKTGAQDFERLYEFLKRVQGEEPVITTSIQALLEKPIGDGEKRRGVKSSGGEKKSPVVKTVAGEVALTPVNAAKSSGAVPAKVDRF